MRKFMVLLVLLLSNLIFAVKMPETKVHFIVGKLYMNSGKGWKPAKKGDLLKKNYMLKSLKKSIFIVQLGNKKVKITGAHIIKVKDLITNKDHIKGFLKMSGLRQRLSGYFIKRAYPAKTLGVRASEEETVSVQWQDDLEEDTPSQKSPVSRAREHYIKGEYGSAVKVLEEKHGEIKKLEEAESYYLLGISYFHLGNYRKTIQYLSQFLKEKNYSKSSHKAVSYYLLSQAYALYGQASEASKVLNQFIAKFPKQANTAQVYFLLAGSYIELKQSSKAKKTLVHIIDYFPKSALAEDAKDMLRKLK